MPVRTRKKGRTYQGKKVTRERMFITRRGAHYINILDKRIDLLFVIAIRDLFFVIACCTFGLRCQGTGA